MIIQPLLRTFLLSALIIGLLTAGASGENLPAITKEEAAKSLREHSAEWTEKIRTTKPRLYFSEDEWDQVRKEIEDLTGKRAELRKAFFEKVDAILEEPAPEYQPPEKMTGTRGDAKTIYMAMEELWERIVGDKIMALALASKLRSNDRYTSKLHELVLAVLNFETWGRAKEPMGNNSDLAAGHISRAIAIAYDWHRDAFTPEEQKKIRETIAERVPNILRGLYGDAFWARGFEENHNHVSVIGLAFCGIAFYDEIPEAPTWLAASRLNFENVARSLPADGSSVEGVSYWAYGLGFVLQYIEGTRRIIDSSKLYDSPFFRNAAAYRLMASTSGFEGNLPWGDAVMKDWGSPQYILHGLAARYQDENASWLAAHLSDPFRTGIDSLGFSMLWSRLAPAPGAAPSALDHRLTVNDMVTSRSGWEPADYTLAFKGGFTNRNHSHLDAGALAIAFGEEWVLAAPGYGKGTGIASFWDRSETGGRWKFFSNATESHSTLLINGQNQLSDRKAHASITEFFTSPDWSDTVMDLSGVYADVKSVSREVLHHRGDYILVFDQVTAAEPATVEWLAQFLKESPESQDGSILGQGTKGKVLIRMLEPFGGFKPRQPTSQTVDPSKPQFTYAAKTEGTAVNFAAFIQPVVSGSAAPSLKIQAIAATDGGIAVEVTGDGWTDEIVRTAKASDQSLGADAEMKCTARVASLRRTEKGPAALLALDATSISLPGFSFSSTIPTDLSARKLDNGSWEVWADRDVQSTIAPPSVKAHVIQDSLK